MNPATAIALVGGLLVWFVFLVALLRWPGRTVGFAVALLAWVVLGPAAFGVVLGATAAGAVARNRCDARWRMTRQRASARVVPGDSSAVVPRSVRPAGALACS